MTHVSIADEVESFFNVLLYYALRYIETANCNASSAARFLNRYFNAYLYEDGVYSCGIPKRMAIKQGEICVGSTFVPIRFYNPLDALFDRMLSWFQARYTVLDYKVRKEDEDKRQAASTASRTDSPPRKRRKPSASVLKALAGRPRVEPLPHGIKPPSEQEMALVEHLNSHNSLVFALGAALCAEWPEQTVEDQIPSR